MHSEVTCGDTCWLTLIDLDLGAGFDAINHTFLLIAFTIFEVQDWLSAGSAISESYYDAWGFPLGAPVSSYTLKTCTRS